MEKKTSKVAFIGLGAAGGNICELAGIADFSVGIMNTSPEDLASIKTIDNKLLIGNNGGAGKDRKIAKEDVKKDYKQIISFVNDKFRESELIYVTFSASGGTGSGMGPLIIDLLSRSVPDKKFGAVVVLPTKQESTVAQYNAIECLNELGRLNVPYFIVDNQKVVDRNNAVSRRQLYDEINTSVVESIEAIFLEREASKYGNIDGKDIIKILSTPGNCIISDITITDENTPLNKQITSSFNRTVFGKLQNDSVVKRMGLFVEVRDAITKTLDMNELYRDLGNPLEVFEGYYRPEDNNQTVTTILSGLSFPTDRINEMVKLLEESKDKIVDNSTKSVDVDASWFTDMRNESVTKSSSLSIFDNDDSSESVSGIDDLFSNY